MVRLDPDGMGARTRVLSSVKRLAVPETEGFYQALSADAGGADGVIPSGVLSDEVHRQKKRDLYDLLEGGTEPRDQPLTVNLTTTGKDGDSQLYDGLHGHAVAVQSGLVVDPTWYVDVRNLPKVDRIGEKVDWRSQRYWFVSNPALGSAKEIAEGEAFKPAERLKERVKRIESDPSSETFVRRYHLGQSIDDLGAFPRSRVKPRTTPSEPPMHPEPMTDEEHQVMDLLTQVANLMLNWAPQDHPDRNEITTKVHDLQHMVMAQAAARAYPDRYRPIGRSPNSTD